MGENKMKTRKGAAAIYIVTFTATLLSIIVLSFARIMLAESTRTMNYSLSQSAYNSALAGVEDAKIVLLRYQNCLERGSYNSSSNLPASDCDEYLKLFDSYDDATKTSRDCNVVGKRLHGTKDTDLETFIRTNKDTDNSRTVDQAYTCVKISAFTEDFLAVLNDDLPTKIIPIRSENQTTQNDLNRILIEWYTDKNQSDDEVLKADGTLKSTYDGFYTTTSGGSNFKGKLTSNKGAYDKSSNTNFANAFSSKTAIVPPVLQVTYMQTPQNFTISDFYTTGGISDSSRTNRGTLLLRPTSNTDIWSSMKITENGNHSNVLPKNALSYAGNKSFNTPIDVYCQPTKPGSSEDQPWGDYFCSAEIYIPKPNNSNTRNRLTSYLTVNLPYGGPETDVSVKMFKCNDADAGKPISESSCETVYFANVQPKVDSTGRANDLFRRVESRIELADTNFPVANYALAVTNKESKGVTKNYYTTYDCKYSTTAPVLKTDGSYDVNYNGGSTAAGFEFNGFTYMNTCTKGDTDGANGQ